MSVLNGNALWKVTLPATGDAPWILDFSYSASMERDTAFRTNDNWTFTKTAAGKAYGTVDGAGKYVTNPCFPLSFFVTDRWMLAFMDNWGGPSDSSHTFGQVFNMQTDAVATAPTLGAGDTLNGPAATTDLHSVLTSPDDVAAQLAGEFMTYDYSKLTATNVELVFNTSSNTSSAPSAGLWKWVAPLAP